MAAPLSQPADIPNPRPSRNRFGSFAASLPIAQDSIARDAELDPQDAADDGEDDSAGPGTLRKQPSQGYSMSGSYRRPSFMAGGGSRCTVVPSLQRADGGYMTQQEWDRMREEERSLLRDNQVIPPKHPRKPSDAAGASKATGFLSALRRKSRTDEEAVDGQQESESAQENTPLLGGGGDPSLPYGGQDSPEEIDRKWEEAVQAGMIQTSWKREAKVLGRYSRSLVLTFLLQYSLPVASVFTVGHLGTIELGAVSLGSMTANITGYAVMQGLATSLDTLCSQAYGSGHKKLVGLQLQRMVYFLWVCCIPIGGIWLSGTAILEHIVPEKETAAMAG